MQKLLSSRLTDKKTASDIYDIEKGLQEAGRPEDVGNERYIKLAFFEDLYEEELKNGRELHRGD